MDYVLTKPAELATLRATLLKWLPSAATAIRVREDIPNAGSGALDSAAAVRFAALDKIAATDAERAEILRDYMTQTRSDFVKLGTALTMHDFPACARIAHRMKGSSRMVGVQDLATACETMERAARHCGPEDVSVAKAAMDLALVRLEASLAVTTDASVSRK
jgi:two-component system, NarL family, sensor histidine kinase EvgS